MQGVWHVNHEYGGLEVRFPSKPSAETLNLLKANGFRWSHRQGIWYAKDSAHRRTILERIATRGEDIGEPLSYAERLERQRERIKYRQEQLKQRAARAEKQAKAYYRAAEEIMDRIPFGQPILVGHHSERRHRRDLARIDQRLQKGRENLHKAKALRERLEASQRHTERMERPDVIARRIKRLEADLRTLERNRRYWGDGEAWQRRYDEVSERLTYWREQLEALGGIAYGPDNIKKGDIIKTRHGPGKVVRVNQKTVTVDLLVDYLPEPLRKGYKVEYERILGVLKSA